MLKFPKKRYNIIYADPPWPYNDKRGPGGIGAARQYETPSMEWIASLPVKSIADKDCVLFLWVTMPLLSEVWPVIKSWGFSYKTVGFVWVKTIHKGRALRYGYGNWTKPNIEMCLIATRGKPRRVSKTVSQIIIAPRGRHSQKPEEVRDRIVELCGDLPRIELFAREHPKGWDVWGNQAPEEERHSLFDIT